jgi:pilus assembly protein FimV
MFSVSNRSFIPLMHWTRAALSVVFAAGLAMGCGVAAAVGVGNPPSSVWLGQTLDYEVPLRIAPGGEVDPACVRASVSLGDRLLLPTQVVTRLDRRDTGATVVQVQTSVVVDEPVVTVDLEIGCPVQFRRRFLALADPPGFRPPSPMPPALADLPSARAVANGAGPAAAPAAASAPVAAPPAAVAAAAPAPAAAVASRATARAGEGPRPAVRAALAPRPPRPSGAEPAPGAARRAPTARLRLDVAPASPAAATLANIPAPPAGDAVQQAAMVEEALTAVAEAASALRSARAAASAAQERAQGLERTLQQLRAEAQAEGQARSLMRERLAHAEAISNWLWPLLLGLLVLSGLAGWMAWQLAVLRRDRAQGWALAAAAAGATGGAVEAAPSAIDRQGGGASAGPSAVAGAGPARHETYAPPGAAPTYRPLPAQEAGADPTGERASPADQFASTQTLGTAAWPAGSSGDTEPALLTPQPDVTRPAVAGGGAASSPGIAGANAGLARREPPPPLSQQTLPMPSPVLPASTFRLGALQPAPTRDLSIEELIDLEQQAEFFIVLGQDEAAIDLLVEHIRSTGGVSPLPYLKLLEVYRRQGAREGYERTRVRFNQRFNAYAPDWTADPAQGRSLEGYPEVLPQLIQVWPKPLDAMAALEAMLFRKTDGELFDLPAYRELLFLYAMARDLLDREAVATGTVDLLLPLAEERDFSNTGPHPYFGLDHDSVFDRQVALDSPTSPVDFDLSPELRSRRIFDPLTAGRLPLRGQTDIDGGAAPPNGQRRQLPG